MRRGISFAMRDDGRDAGHRAFIGARIWWPTAVVRKGGSYREEGSRGDTPRLSDSIIIMPHFFNMNTRVSMARSRDRARLLHSILVVRGRLVELPGAG
jgi:hypothetical protein